MGPRAVPDKMEKKKISVRMGNGVLVVQPIE
jgi:hypothetical protein